MNNSQNILQELQELESILASAIPHIPYSVPAGYFEGLPELVLSRIKTPEAISVTDELDILSPTLAKISTKAVFDVPQSYFEALPEKMLANIKKMSANESTQEELGNISPLLSGLKKEMPYYVPQGYFENKLITPGKPEVQVVSISKRKWFRYAAAAVVVGVLLIAGVLYKSQQSTGTAHSLAKFEKKLLKEIKKTSDKELDEFLVQFSDAGLTGEEKVSTEADKEVKELLKDVSETELQKFLEETSEGDASANTEEPSIMN